MAGNDFHFPGKFFMKGFYVPLYVEFFSNLKKGAQFNDVIRLTPGLGYSPNEKWRLQVDTDVDESSYRILIFHIQMTMRFLLNISFAIFIMHSLSLQGTCQVNDTLQLERTEILILEDTMYFGLSDSLIVLPTGTDYKITQNSLRNAKFLQDLYRGTAVSGTSSQEIQDGEFLNATQQFSMYEGKIIRNISIKQVDVMEGNVRDTSITAVSGFGTFLNRAKYTTRPWVIRYNLRFKTNQALSPEIMAENERLLRNRPYLQDAKIYVKQKDYLSDSVDIIIVTQDNFPIGVSGFFNHINHFGIEPYTRNFLGLGHNLAGRIIWDGGAEQKIGYGANYRIDNIKGTFTSLTMDYINTAQENLYRFRVYKPFLTNDTRYGGELNIYQLATIKYWGDKVSDTIYRYADPYKMNVTDIWLGRSFHPDRSNPNQFFNLGLRYLSERYIERPYIEMDSNRIFHDNHTYLGSISFWGLKYFTTNKLLGYGTAEDVPEGIVVKLTLGYRHNEFINSPYSGITLALAKYYPKFGYLTFNMASGGFLYQKQVQDVMLGARLAYYSPLTKLNRYQIRHFFIPTFTTFSNPFYIRPENFGDRIRGLLQDDIFSTSTLVFRYESMLYTPFSLIGFNMAASAFADIGWVTDRDYMTGSSEMRSVIGISLHIKNESLTIPTMSVRLGYYPRWMDEKNKFRITFSFADRFLFPTSNSVKPELYYQR